MPVRKTKKGVRPEHVPVEDWKAITARLNEASSDQLVMMIALFADQSESRDFQTAENGRICKELVMDELHDRGIDVGPR